MKKICSICEEEKDISEYHMRGDKPLSRCKECQNKASKEWYIKNKEKKLEYSKNWHQDNPDKVKGYKKKYYEKNKELMNERSAEWNKKNKQRHVKAVMRSQRKRYKKDPLYRLEITVRKGVTRVAQAVKQDKELRSLEYLGCSLEEFKSHIESLWSEGMSWDNHGDWHIDHKIPLNWYVKNSDDPWEANHYSNLQPLWATDNLSKGSSI